VGYVRKTPARIPVPAAWLKRHRRQLLALRFKPDQLEIVFLHDVKGLSFAQIAPRFQVTSVRIGQIYRHFCRRLKHPALAALVPPELRSGNS
jgi:hypothetical protein